MSEKKLKIIAVVLMVAAFICLAIGTAFAVDFMAEHPEEFACDLKRPVVAANRPLVEPVVEPLKFPVEGTDWVFDIGSYSQVTPTPTSFSGVFSLFLGTRSLYLYDDELNPVYVEFLGFSENSDIVSSSDSAFMTLYSGPYAVSYFDRTLVLTTESGVEFTISFSETASGYFRSFSPVSVFDENDEPAALGDFSVFIFDSATVVSPIISTLVSGLRSLGANVGRAFSTIANAIFINADGTGLSTFGILVVVFAAVSLGLSLTRWVLNFCGSWGKRNR